MAKKKTRNQFTKTTVVKDGYFEEGEYDKWPSISGVGLEEFLPSSSLEGMGTFTIKVSFVPNRRLKRKPRKK